MRSPGRRGCRTRRAPTGRPPRSDRRWPDGAGSGRRRRRRSPRHGERRPRLPPGMPGSRRERLALDEHELLGPFVESVLEDPLRPAGLARGRLAVGQLLRADGASENDRDDHERDPSEGRRLPVRGTPAPRACRQIELHGLPPLLDIAHESSVAGAPGWPMAPPGVCAGGTGRAVRWGYLQSGLRGSSMTRAVVVAVATTFPSGRQIRHEDGDIAVAADDRPRAVRVGTPSPAPAPQTWQRGWLLALACACVRGRTKSLSYREAATRPVSRSAPLAR